MLHRIPVCKTIQRSREGRGKSTLWPSQVTTLVGLLFQFQTLGTVYNIISIRHKGETVKVNLICPPRKTLGKCSEGRHDSMSLI